MAVIIGIGETWTESRVSGLPKEDDRFDRKCGELLDKPSFDEDFGKALSAFGNSGGGTIFLGVNDDGTFDGVPVIRKGRESTKDWLEKRIPQLTDYPLVRFRVQEVLPEPLGSAIPPNRVVIAIDIFESPAAPHQVARTGTYYWRQSGTSKPAPHFFLESVRNRPERAVLGLELRQVQMRRSIGDPDRSPTSDDLVITFALINQSPTTAANRKSVRPEFVVTNGAAFEIHMTGLRVNEDQPIMPLMVQICECSCRVEFPFSYGPSNQLALAVLRSTTVFWHVSSDTFASAPVEMKLGEALGITRAADGFFPEVARPHLLRLID